MALLALLELPSCPKEKTVPPPRPPWEADVARYSAQDVPESPQKRQEVASHLEECLNREGSRGLCLGVLAGLKAEAARQARNESMVMEEAARLVQAEASGGGEGKSGGPPDEEATLAQATVDAAEMGAKDARQVAFAALDVAREALTTAEVVCEREIGAATPAWKPRLAAAKVAAVYAHARLLEDFGDPQGAFDVLTRCETGCEQGRPPEAFCEDARLGVGRAPPHQLRTWLVACRGDVFAQENPSEEQLRAVARAEDAVEPDAVAHRDGCVRKMRPWSVPNAVARRGRIGKEGCERAVAELGMEAILGQQEFRRRHRSATRRELEDELKDSESSKRFFTWFTGPVGQGAQVAFRLALTGYCGCIEDSPRYTAPP